MQFGTQISNAGISWRQYADLARSLDEMPYSSVWSFDHLMPTMGSEHQDCLEGWSLVAGLALSTQRLEIGCLVSSITFRPPAVLAKMAATIHEMSGGRLTVGLGAGWFEREHEAYGIDFPEVGERADRLEEYAHAVRLLLGSDGPVTFEGRYYRLQGAPFAPRPQRCPPLLIGGGGERKTLRTVALYGDAMNVFGTPVEVSHKLHVLRQHCHEVGRDPGEIRKTVTLRVKIVDDEREAQRLRAQAERSPGRRQNVPIGNTSHLLSLARRYEALGIDEIVLQGMPPSVAAYDRFAREVVETFQASPSTAVPLRRREEAEQPAESSTSRAELST